MIMWIRLGIISAIVLSVIAFGRYHHNEPKVNASRFQKLNKEGQPISVWQGPWACVVDKKTGLVWENKTDDESIHDGYWSYSWFNDGQGVENSGDCYFEKDRCDTADLIRRMNKEKTCGLTQWRLPTAEELLTLVNHHPKTGEAKIANDFFLHTKRGDYWTSNAEVPLSGVFQHLGKGAQAVDFIEGKIRNLPYRNAAFVRLVAQRSDK